LERKVKKNGNPIIEFRTSVRATNGVRGKKKRRKKKLGRGGGEENGVKRLIFSYDGWPVLGEGERNDQQNILGNR